MPNRFRFVLFTGLLFSLIILTSLNVKTIAQFGDALSREQIKSHVSYVHPLPDSDWVSTSSQITFRPLFETNGLLPEKTVWQVTGSKSGAIEGKSVLAEDKNTQIFIPNHKFQHDEQIFVTVNGISFTFLIAPQLPENLTVQPFQKPEDIEIKIPEINGRTGELSRTEPYRTAPDDLPIFDVTIHEPDMIGDGYVFIGHYDISGINRITPYLMIIDNNGEPVYYDRLDDHPAVIDFKRQKLHENLFTYHDTTNRRVHLVNENYRRVRSYTVGDDYVTDWHDFQLEANGNALMMIHDYRLVDMTQYHPYGDPSALVVGCILREITPSGNIVFEWRSWDHIPITDTNQLLTDSTVRYIHCNSIERDFDGHLLISSRHLNEVTKIHGETGEIIWRLGGPQNDFLFTNDNGFSYQHSARREFDRIAIFDNGNDNVPKRSRGVEYVLDEINMTATRVWEYDPDPVIYSSFMGNMQRLSNWNRMLGWGGIFHNIATEVRGSSQPVWELNNLDNIGGSYRAFRNTWEGHPTWPPTLVAESIPQNINNNEASTQAKLYFSYNGATEVTQYEIHTVINGVDTVVDIVPRDGFETVYEYTLPVRSTLWFYVVPMLEDGVKLRASGQVAVLSESIPMFLPFISSPVSE